MLHLYVVRVWAFSVGRRNAGLNRLNPRLSQLLGLGLKHTAPMRRTKVLLPIKTGHLHRSAVRYTNFLTKFSVQSNPI